MRLSKIPKCKCGTTIGCWFCERLGEWKCSICLDTEVTVLIARMRELEEEVQRLRTTWQPPEDDHER